MIEVSTVFEVTPGPKVTVIKRDREAEHYAKQNVKAAILSLGRLYPDAFREAVDILLLSNKRMVK